MKKIIFIFIAFIILAIGGIAFVGVEYELERTARLTREMYDSLTVGQTIGQFSIAHAGYMPFVKPIILLPLEGTMYLTHASSS